jgi:hypothetical protein
MTYTKAELLKVLSENKGLEVIVMNQSHSYDVSRSYLVRIAKRVKSITITKDGILVILK